MHKYTIVVFWSNEDQAYIAQCPGIKEFSLLSGISENMMEAIEILNEAIEFSIKTLKERNYKIPESNLQDYNKIESIFDLDYKNKNLKKARSHSLSHS